MDLYKRRRLWKLIIVLSALLISTLSMIYTNYIVDKLEVEERKKMELYAFALKKFAEFDDLEADMGLVTEIITRNTTVPLILTNNKDSIIAFVNFDPVRSRDYSFMQKELVRIKHDREPIVINLLNNDVQYVYYKDSVMLSMLFWYPIIQTFIFALFIIVAYIAFSNSRKAEQNRVWIGLSKETAHQLGTPISSLLAWLEILKDHPGLESYIPEIEKDINRLDTIARRFSKVGSAPELTPAPIVPVLFNAIEYMQYRTSGKIQFKLNSRVESTRTIMLNKSLFEWVIENLIRNAADAMHGEGTLGCDIIELSNKIIIDISDTGKGMPKHLQKTIFNPGFTTKQRGWGLGLSLSKRIIENYHNGKIFVKSSEVNKGTTFRIILNA